MAADRPPTDWEARVAKAKRDGGWYGPDDEPSPYPPRVRRTRFWTGFAVTLVAAAALGVLLHVITGRPGPPFSGNALLDALFRGLPIAWLAGWSCTRPPRRKCRRTR